jgi:hypothetical protein
MRIGEHKLRARAVEIDHQLRHHLAAPLLAPCHLEPFSKPIGLEPQTLGILDGIVIPGTPNV